MGGGRFELGLTIRTGGVEESRTIDAATCSALAEATAVVIALAIHSIERVACRTTAARAIRATRAARAGACDTRDTSSGTTPHAVTTFVAIGDGVSVSLRPSGSGVARHGHAPGARRRHARRAAVRIDRVRLGVLGTLWFRQLPPSTRAARPARSFDMIGVGAFGGYMVPFGVLALGLSRTSRQLRAGPRLRHSRPRATWTGWPTAVARGRGEVRLTSWLGLFARARRRLSGGCADVHPGRRRQRGFPA